MPRALLSFSLLNLVLFLGCIGGKDDADGDSAVEPDVIDADNDGVRVEADCDDNDASVYPNAAELCDERDNDCDGSVDEGLDASYYTDEDGDGFGLDGSEVVACEAPEGTVERGGDCDDNNPNRAAFCEYATVSGEWSAPSLSCRFSVSGEATDPSTSCPSCDFGFLSTSTQTTSNPDCIGSFLAIFAYDIDAESMNFVFNISDSYVEVGPFPGTLTYGAEYDTLSFYGPSSLSGRTYEGTLTLHP